MRIGIDADHVTYLDAGRIAEAEGVSAVALHGRTGRAVVLGQADWEAIARLKEAVTTVPCSATATSGRPRTRSRWSGAPAATASSSGAGASAAVAVHRPRAAFAAPTTGSSRACAR